jgi:hypothetical protein
LNDHLRKAKVTLMLAQAAQAVPNGTVSLLGGGMTQIPASMPFAIGGTIELPWDAAGVQHKFRLELLDSHGKPVMVDNPEGRQNPLLIEGVFEVAPQPGLKRGTPLSMPIAINMSPQPLAPATRYEWRIEIDDETHEDWRLGFNTLPPGPQAMAA